MKRLLVIFVGLAILPACAKFSSRAENAARPSETREVAKTHEGDSARLISQTIAFEKGSASLNDEGKASLRKMVDDMRARGDLDKVKIAAWSDRQFMPNADLPKADRTLAKDRITAINNYLKDDLDVSNTDTFNMAERSNWLARLFRTEDSELKSVFSRADTPISDDEFQLIKSNGSPSHAVVISRHEH